MKVTTKIMKIVEGKSRLRHKLGQCEASSEATHTKHTQQHTTSPGPVGSGGCLLHKVMYIIIHKVAYIVGITITPSVCVVVVAAAAGIKITTTNTRKSLAAGWVVRGAKAT